ncbi:hypothetical protein [Polaromonas sp. UC242_47]|uniref:hypothetical protein n=1 Tax=Polaromonas sp. UC242_47 TaxID=3374626 RepID=UPI0037BCA334
MNRVPAFDGLQISLLALLPKDGTPVTVTTLAETTAAEPSAVIEALLDPFMAGNVIFDVRC